MKRIFQWMSVGFLTLMILCSWNTGLKSEGEKIVVNLNEKGAEVPSSFYGIFFEEINHAGDGGLYAELVQNRSFEDGHLPEGFSLKGNILVPPQVKYHLTGEVKKIEDRKMRWNPDPIRGWSLQVKDPTAANIKITDEHPFFETAPHSLEVSITDASEEVAVVNSGFWGMNIEDKGTYFFRSIIRVSPEYKGKVEARLITESGQVPATCPIATAEPGKWNDVQNTLISSGKDAKAKLAIVFKGTGKVWLDYVSLFPEDTYKGRKNGLRKDIAQMIADLKPSFVRWPGGTMDCWFPMRKAVNWKFLFMGVKLQSKEKLIIGVAMPK